MHAFHVWRIVKLCVGKSQVCGSLWLCRTCLVCKVKGSFVALVSLFYRSLSYHLVFSGIIDNSWSGFLVLHTYLMMRWFLVLTLAGGDVIAIL